MFREGDLVKLLVQRKNEGLRPFHYHGLYDGSIGLVVSLIGWEELRGLVVNVMFQTVTMVVRPEDLKIVLEP